MRTIPDLKASLAAKRKAGPAQATRISSAELVEIEAGGLPTIVRPKTAGIRLQDWVVDNRALIERHVLDAGAVLFRGFDISQIPTFEQTVAALCPKLMSYTEGATPRKTLKDKVYTSTEFPQDYSIAQHNELSYTLLWPLRLFFACSIAAEWRGETPISDVRKVYQRIPTQIRERFERCGWMLVRNYGDGFSLPWQTVFHTDDRAEVEAYCARNNIAFEWKDGDKLRTRQVRPATRLHPTTGELVWFNHAAFWHISSLQPTDLRDEFMRQMAADEMPYNTFYGDGSPIEPGVADALRQAYDAETRALPWQVGDLIMIDNMLVSHGRGPYRGARRILTAMGDAYSPATHSPATH
ncbi:MAG TPA: TauD/TfdA family dioxygenase [Kofleriaceae bacterium]|nr:TauD/TfdA family dioxygenase [Kofleriaceae bacterium]